MFDSQMRMTTSNGRPGLEKKQKALMSPPMPMFYMDLLLYLEPKRKAWGRLMPELCWGREVHFDKKGCVPSHTNHNKLTGIMSGLRAGEFKANL